MLWEFIQGLLSVLGVFFIIGAILCACYISVNKKRNFNIAYCLFMVCFCLFLIDVNLQRNHLTVGKIAYKQYLEPNGPDQSPYAILVVREEQHLLFRLPEDDFSDNPDYKLDRRIPIIFHRGLITGYPYSVTLHQPKDYVHK